MCGLRWDCDGPLGGSRALSLHLVFGPYGGCAGTPLDGYLVCPGVPADRACWLWAVPGAF